MLSLSEYQKLKLRKPSLMEVLMSGPEGEHGLVLVTRNVKEVERTGVNYLNPFDPAH